MPWGYTYFSPTQVIMRMAEPFGAESPVGHSPVLAKAAEESRNIEFGLLKMLLTVDGGALTLSIGFILGERRIALAAELIWWVEFAWGVLVFSMVCGLVCWVVTSIASTAHASGLSKFLQKIRGDVPNYQSAGIIATVMACLTALLCIVGLASLAWVALRMVATVSGPPLIGLSSQ